MKSLKDLKDDILHKKFNKFYVFCGDDYGLRHHYIQEIKKYFDSCISIYDFDTYVAKLNRN